MSENMNEWIYTGKNQLTINYNTQLYIQMNISKTITVKGLHSRLYVGWQTHHLWFLQQSQSVSTTHGMCTTWKLLNNLPMASQLRSKANHLYKVFILIKTTFLLLKEYRVQNKFAKKISLKLIKKIIPLMAKTIPHKCHKSMWAKQEDAPHSCNHFHDLTAQWMVVTREKEQSHLTEASEKCCF